MAVTPPRGMRDFPPSTKRKRESLLKLMAEVYHLHGFEAIETPALENSEVLDSGMGGENEKLSFKILRRGLAASDLVSLKNIDSLSDLGLRFDLTVPLARFYASNRGKLPQVFRAFHVGPVWRAEKPQKGRYRQFLQCDIDVIGEAGLLAELEAIRATADFLARSGLQDFTFRINDRRLLEELLTKVGIMPKDQPSTMIALDKIEKVGIEQVISDVKTLVSANFDEAKLRAFLGLSVGKTGLHDVVSELESFGLSGPTLSGLLELASLAEVSLGADKIRIDPSLVRGMGYYTSSIVEISHPSLGSSLGGGGRYDGMIGKFLGTEVPAFGISLGFERLTELVEELPPDGPKRSALVVSPGVELTTVLAIKQSLVESGEAVRVIRHRKNMRPIYEQLVDDGIFRVADLRPEMDNIKELSWRNLDDASS